MGLNEFRLKTSFGKLFDINNLKELKKSDLKNNAELIKIFDFFNTNKAVDGEEEVLDKQELVSLFNTISKASQKRTPNDSIFDAQEADDFMDTDGRELKKQGIGANELFDFLSALVKEDKEAKNNKTNAFDKMFQDTISPQNIPDSNQIISNAEKAKLQDIKTNPNYLRKEQTDNLGRTVIYVKDSKGNSIGKINGDGSIELYKETKNGKTSGTTYSPDGRVLYNFEYDDEIKKGNKYRTQTRYYSDRIEELDGKGNSKTYNIRYMAGGSIAVKGDVIKSMENEYDNAGNIVKQTTIDNIKGTKTVLDSKINGFVYDKNGNILQEVNTVWDETGTKKLFQTIHTLSDNSVKTILFSTPEELTSPQNVHQARRYVLENLRAQVIGAITMMDGLEKGMDFLDKCTDGLLVLGDLGIDGLTNKIGGSSSDIITSQVELKNKLHELNSKLGKLNPANQDFEAKFEEITGKKFSQIMGDVILLQEVSSKYNEIQFFESASNSVDKFLNKEYPAPSKDDILAGRETPSIKTRLEAAKVLAATITGNKAEAEFRINAISKFISEDDIEKELAKYLKSIQTPVKDKISEMKSSVNYDLMPEQIKQLQEKVFGKDVASRVENMGTAFTIGKMAWITALTMGATTAVTGTAAFGAFAEGLTASYGPIVGFLGTKLAATAIGTAAATAVTTLNTYSMDEATIADAIHAGIETIGTSTKYGLFGAFVSGPSGEVTKKFIQAICANSGRVMEIASSVLGVGTETSLDVLFDRLTSDLTIKESLTQNGGMNFAMMIVGGQINRNIKVKCNTDGTVTLKDGAKTHNFKSRAELMKHIMGSEFLGAGVNGVNGVNKGGNERPDFGLNISKKDNIKNLYGSNKEAKARLANFFKENPNINQAEFKKYIQSVDMDKVAELAPEIKNYSIEQKELFLKIHYLRGIKNFTQADLTLPEKLDNLLSREPIVGKDLDNLLTVFPLTQRELGGIPDGWLTGGNDANIKNVLDSFVKEIKQFESDFIQKDLDMQGDEHIMEMDGKLTWDEIQSRRIKRKEEHEQQRVTYAKKLEIELSNALGKPTKVEYIGGGCSKHAFKVSVEGADPVVIDVFHSGQKSDDSHGQWTEIPIGPFLNTHSGGQSDNFAHFYYGKYDENGYSILQFIDRKGENKQLNTNTNDYVVQTTDRQADNILNGVVVDYGKLRISKPTDGRKPWTLEDYVTTAPKPKQPTKLEDHPSPQPSPTGGEGAVPRFSRQNPAGVNGKGTENTPLRPSDTSPAGVNKGGAEAPSGSKPKQLGKKEKVLEGGVKESDLMEVAWEARHLADPTDVVANPIHSMEAAEKICNELKLNDADKIIIQNLKDGEVHRISGPDNTEVIITKQGEDYGVEIVSKSESGSLKSGVKGSIYTNPNEVRFGTMEPRHAYDINPDILPILDLGYGLQVNLNRPEYAWRIYALKEGGEPLIIGRNGQVPIDEKYDWVSGQHVAIYRQGGKLKIQDISRNGTTIACDASDAYVKQCAEGPMEQHQGYALNIDKLPTIELSGGEKLDLSVYKARIANIREGQSLTIGKEGDIWFGGNNVMLQHLVVYRSNGELKIKNLSAIPTNIAKNGFMPRITNKIKNLLETPSNSNIKLTQTEQRILTVFKDHPQIRALHSNPTELKKVLVNMEKIVNDRTLVSTEVRDAIMTGTSKLNSPVDNVTNVKCEVEENMMNDIVKLAKGEDYITEFPRGVNEREVMSKVPVGEVAKVNGRLWVNNGSSMEEINMSEQTFRKLFPPVKRFSTHQGSVGTCYLVSVLERMYASPNGRVELYKRIGEDQNGIYTKTYNSGYEKTYFNRFDSKHKHILEEGGLSIIEQGWCKNSAKGARVFNPRETIIMDVNSGGRSNVAIGGLLGIQPTFVDFSPVKGRDGKYRFPTPQEIQQKKDSIRRYIMQFGNDKNSIINFGTPSNGHNDDRHFVNPKYNLWTGHEYSIKGYDHRTGTVTICNPHLSGVTVKIKLDELVEYIDDFSILNL